jgi:histidyl-tRNA synthetase
MRTLIAPHDAIGLQYLTHWNEVLELLAAYDVPQERIIIQPDLARTWDYYTGLVFELRTDNGIHLGGGGRYDELAKLIGGMRDIPAVGFAYYLDELLMVNGHQATLPSALGLEIAPNTRMVGAKWAHLLRQHGFRVALLPSITQGTSDIKRVLTAVSDGTIVLGNAQFSTDQIDELITELNAQ